MAHPGLVQQLSQRHGRADSRHRNVVSAAPAVGPVAPSGFLHLWPNWVRAFCCDGLGNCTGSVFLSTLALASMLVAVSVCCCGSLTSPHVGKGASDGAFSDGNLDERHIAHHGMRCNSPYTHTARKHTPTAACPWRQHLCTAVLLPTLLSWLDHPGSVIVTTACGHNPWVPLCATQDPQHANSHTTQHNRIGRSCSSCNPASRMAWVRQPAVGLPEHCLVDAFVNMHECHGRMGS